MTTNATPLRNDVARVAHQPKAANGLAIVRLTIGAMLVWVFFENLGKGLYSPAGYAGLINYYIKQGHFAGCVESGHGSGGEQRRDGGSSSSGNRNLARRPPGHRSAHAPGRFCGVLVPYKPLGVGMGHRVDLGTAGSGARLSWARGGARGKSVGHRLVAGAAAAVLSVVVMSQGSVRMSVIIPTRNQASAFSRVLADLPAELGCLEIPLLSP